MERTVFSIQEAWLDQVMAIETVAAVDPWPAEAFASEFGYPWSRFLGAGQHDDLRGLLRLDGYLVYWLFPELEEGQPEAGEAHLLNLVVAPAARRQGVASLLMERLFQELAAQGGGRVDLEVRASNLVAQQLYQGLGFSVAGRRPGYYRKNNEDALIMIREVRATGRMRRMG